MTKRQENRAGVSRPELEGPGSAPLDQPDPSADLSGDYARDAHRGGFGDDYAREAHEPGTGALVPQSSSDAQSLSSQGQAGDSPTAQRGRGPKNSGAKPAPRKK